VSTIKPLGHESKFTYKYYEAMLAKAITMGFCISSFEHYSSENEKTIILRHDVDYTINGVIQLAEIEARLGVTATYLFRIHAHEYNVLTPHVNALIKTLLDMGHEIGLHNEAMTVSRATNRDPMELLKIGKQVLELAADVQIKTCSEHRDVSHVVHGTGKFNDHYDCHEAGIINDSMESRFFKQMKYLSDANGVWREGDLLQHLDEHNRFQVLVHPDWWFEHDLLLKGPYFHGLGN